MNTSSPSFLDSHDPPTGVRSENAKFPPILQITLGNFTLSLLPSELEKIDNLLAGGGEKPSILASVHEEVTGSKQDRPDVSSAWKQRNPWQCAFARSTRRKA